MTGRSLEKVLDAKKEIESSNPGTSSRLSVVQLDVTNSSSVEAAARQVRETWGHLDALINNAAVGNIQSPDVRVRFQRCLETNVTGAAAVADTFRPLLLKASSKPYSIFVSSGAGSVSPCTLSSHASTRTSKKEKYMILVVCLRCRTGLPGSDPELMVDSSHAHQHVFSRPTPLRRVSLRPLIRLLTTRPRRR